MGLFQKQIIQGEEMFSKNFNVLLILFFLIITLPKILNAEEESIAKVIRYIDEINNLSVSFIQDDTKGLISQGKIYVGEKRIRVEYLDPTKILLILDENKAMYYNYDLDEDEFFNPKNTTASVLFDIFKNNNKFYLEWETIKKENNLIIYKNSQLDEKDFLISLYFEINPLILRKIYFDTQDERIRLSFFNHQTEDGFPKNYFKLINPKNFN